MKTFNRFAALLLAALFCCIGLFGCNTVRGMGKDIQRGGQAIQDAADSTRR